MHIHISRIALVVLIVIYKINQTIYLNILFFITEINMRTSLILQDQNFSRTLIINNLDAGA